MLKKVSTSHWIFDLKTDVLFLSSLYFFVALSVLMKFTLPSQYFHISFVSIGIILGWSHTLAPLFLVFQCNYSKLIEDEVWKRAQKYSLFFASFLTIYYICAFFFLRLTGNYDISLAILLLPPLGHFIWNFFHFGKQNYGLINFYNHKFQLLSSRKWENAFCLFSSGLVVPSIVLTHLTKWILPETLPPWTSHALWLGVATVFVLGLPLLFTKESTWGKRMCILMVLLQPLLLKVDFNAFHLLAFVYPHWLAEIFLIHQLKRHSPLNREPSVPWRFSLSVIFLGTAVALAIQHLSQTIPLKRFFTLTVPWYGYEFSESLLILGYVISTFYAIFTYLHFYLDGIIYRASSYKDPDFLARALNLSSERRTTT